MIVHAEIIWLNNDFDGFELTGILLYLKKIKGLLVQIVCNIINATTKTFQNYFTFLSCLGGSFRRSEK